MQKERQYLCFCCVDLNKGAHVGCFITQLCCHSTLFTPLCAWEPLPPPLTLCMFHNEITFCTLMIELPSFHLPAKLLRFHASLIFPQHIVCRRIGTSLSSPCIYIHSGSKFCFSKSRLWVTFNCRKITNQGPVSKFQLPTIFFAHHGVQNAHSLERRYSVETKALMCHAHTHSPKNLAKVKTKLALNCIYTLQIIDSV